MKVYYRGRSAKETMCKITLQKTGWALSNVRHALHQCNILKVSIVFNPLNANPKKWSNILEQIVGNLPTICLSVFDHFMNLALKGLKLVLKK